ncbi:MAG: type II toxin-antitoxin system VapC family toxin [Caldilineaceae bacterium]|nr:type II toxin-antitoxin system VapC family toxin [Caldilineaceae bacterium]MCB9148454.1 type II toxin-antitoxin system VapC family toxin [Caldilineaceae bacterium]MCB9157539.1 type II toxin-antitoxin system VapC family toxin [Caldilineaceae bacterium]
MIVVDTHILIWDALVPERLSPAAKEAIDAANQATGIVVADISLWEIAMLIQKGRIEIQTDCQSFLNLVLQANQIKVRAITPQIASLSTQLPWTVNSDPADRLIAATAIVEGVSLVTADRHLQEAEEVATIW